MTIQAGPAKPSVETFNSGKKTQDRSKSMRGGGKKGSAARPPTDRRHRRTKGYREAIRDRPSTRPGTAEKPATLHGQSVAGYRRDRRGFQRARHSYLMTSASRNPRLSRLRLSSSPRRSPAPLRPHGLRDRGAERHHSEQLWTSVFHSFNSSTHVPCVRAGGTSGREELTTTPCLRMRWKFSVTCVGRERRPALFAWTERNLGLSRPQRD